MSLGVRVCVEIDVCEAVRAVVETEEVDEAIEVVLGVVELGDTTAAAFTSLTLRETSERGG
jgi:hypothetical protein